MSATLPHKRSAMVEPGIDPSFTRPDRVLVTIFLSGHEKPGVRLSILYEGSKENVDSSYKYGCLA